MCAGEEDLGNLFYSNILNYEYYKKNLTKKITHPKEQGFEKMREKLTLLRSCETYLNGSKIQLWFSTILIEAQTRSKNTSNFFKMPLSMIL